MVDTGILQTIWSFPLTNVKWHSVTWPYTMTTPYWSDFVPNSTFYRILSGFHRIFATGVACRQGTLTPPDTWSCPFLGLAFVLLVETSDILYRLDIIPVCDIITGLDIFTESDISPNIGFHRASATGVACQQGTLTPPDTWSRPFGTCIYSTCWDQSFSELVVIYRTMLFEYPSVLSRFCINTLMTYCQLITQTQNYRDQMYSTELEHINTMESKTSASVSDLHLSVERDGQLRTSLYYKRDFISIYIPQTFRSHVATLLLAYRIGESIDLPVHGKPYLAYRTRQSADLTVIGNLVFTPSRDLVFPPSRDQRN